MADLPTRDFRSDSLGPVLAAVAPQDVKAPPPHSTSSSAASPGFSKHLIDFTDYLFQSQK
jgi:hypothetical protein